VNVALSDGQILNIKIETSTRSKSIRLKANIYGIHVIAPVNYDFENITGFVHSRKKWISKVYDYYAKFVDKFGQENSANGNAIYFLGSPYKLQLVSDKTSYNIISHNLKVITFHVKDRRRYKEDIKAWYKSETSNIIFERLPLISRKIGLAYKRVLIKSQKSRWASCSKNKNLNFNSFLAALPSDLVDYVIIHELMHLIELNHSKKFWELVKMQDPNYKHHRKILQRYGCLINNVL
jgi:predicted metal-dependent hydrolase